MSDADRDTARLDSSLTERTELLQPSDANFLGRALGGVVFDWIDICGTIAAMRFSGHRIVTASVDHVAFERAIETGDVVVVRAYVFETGRSSLSVAVEVAREGPDGETDPTTTAYLTYVAVDEAGDTAVVPELRCETDQERSLRDDAISDRARCVDEVHDRVTDD